jgi:hypothetical protein
VLNWVVGPLASRGERKARKGGKKRRRKKRGRRKKGRETPGEVGIFLVQFGSFTPKKFLAPALTRRGARENVAIAPFSSCI